MTLFTIGIFDLTTCVLTGVNADTTLGATDEETGSIFL